MELIRRYVYAVGQQLPPSVRKDVQTELLDLLESELEDRANTAGREPDEAMAMDLLREFGEPRETAARYHPSPRYLIGPRFYPAFIAALKVVAAFTGILFVGVLIFALPTSPLRLSEAYSFSKVWGAATGIINQGFHYAFMALLVFIVIERMAYAQETKLPSRESRPWNPQTLPPLPNSGKFSLGNEVGEIVSCMIMIFLANTYLPQLGSGFRAQIPLLTLYWITALALHAFVLWRGSWSRSLRWAEFGVSCFLIGAFSWVILSNPVAGINPRHLHGLPELRELIGNVILIMVKWVIAYQTIYGGYQLFHLFKPKEEALNGIALEPASATNGAEG
jgi:hypothetical protein